MRFVTLNLGIGEAGALRRAVESALGACPCQEEPSRAPCSGCAALEGIRDDLVRFILPRTDATSAIETEDRALGDWAGALSARPGPAVAELRRRLWVVPTVTADA